jgi:hypothetical protein
MSEDKVDADIKGLVEKADRLVRRATMIAAPSALLAVAAVLTLVTCLSGDNRDGT